MAFYTDRDSEVDVRIGHYILPYSFGNEPKEVIVIRRCARCSHVFEEGHLHYLGVDIAKHFVNLTGCSGVPRLEKPLIIESAPRNAAS